MQVSQQGMTVMRRRMRKQWCRGRQQARRPTKGCKPAVQPPFSARKLSGPR